MAWMLAVALSLSAPVLAAEAPTRAEARWMAASGTPAAISDGVSTARLASRKGVDATLWVRASTDAQGRVQGGYGLRVQTGKAWLVRRQAGIDKTVTGKEGLGGPGGKRAKLELQVQALGPWVLATARDGKSGKELASLILRDEAWTRGVSVLQLDPGHPAAAAVDSVAARPACAGGASGPTGVDRFVTVRPEQADQVTSALGERVRRLEEGREGTVFRTDGRGLEALGCAGVMPQRVSIETPWKYIEGAYLDHRDHPPVRTDLGVRLDLSYKNGAMVGAILRAYQKRYPELTELVTLGKTHEGRPLEALLITRDPAGSAHKPSVYLNATHHGNEPLSTEFVLDAVQQLLEGAGKSPAVDRWLNELRVWCVPVVNPDGAWAFLEHSNRTGRKNGRDHDRDGERGLLEGVDLNRNYPFRWGFLGEKGSRSGASSVYYRGPRAGSEPETAAMMALADREHFAAAVSFHIGTVALLAPYTIDNVKNPDPNLPWIVAEAIAKELPPHPDKPVTVRRNLYPVDGTDQDWLRGTFGTIALLVEGARTSHLDRGRRRASIEAVRPTWMKLFDRLLDGPALSGHVTDAEGRAVTAVVDVAEIVTQEGERWTTRCRDGRFDRLVPQPGAYTLRITVAGQPPYEQRVEVGSARAQVDVRLPFSVAPAVCAR